MQNAHEKTRKNVKKCMQNAQKREKMHGKREKCMLNAQKREKCMMSYQRFKKGGRVAKRQFLEKSVQK